MGSAFEPQGLTKMSVFFAGGVRLGVLLPHFLQSQEAVKASSERGMALLVRKGETETHIFIFPTRALLKWELR